MSKLDNDDKLRNQTNTSKKVSNEKSKKNADVSGCFVWLIIISCILVSVLILTVSPSSANLLSPFFSKIMSSKIIATDAGRWFIGLLVTLIIGLLTIAFSLEAKRKEDEVSSSKKYISDVTATNYQTPSIEKERYIFILPNYISRMFMRLSLKRRWILGSGVILVILVAMLLIFLPKAPIAFTTEKANVIVKLTPYDDITLEDFKEAKAIIAERFRLLAGDEKCDIQIENEQIIASMPLDVFDGMDVRYTIESCVSRPLRLYALAVSRFEYSEINREMITSIEVVDAKSCAVDWVDGGGESVELDPNQPVLKITLSHDGAFLVNSKIEYAKSKNYQFIFAVDTDQYQLGCYGYANYASDKNRTVFYISEPSLSSIEVYQSLAYSFANNPLKDTFSASITYSPEAAWEDVNKDHEKGKYQRNYQEISGDTILIRLSMYTENMTALEANYFLSKIRNRMDMIEYPYCLGNSFDNQWDVMVKTTLEHIGPSILDLLATSKLSITSSLGTIYDVIASSFKNISIEQDDSGYYYLLVVLNNEDIETLHQKSETLLKQGGELYLRTDSGIICACDVSDVIRDGRIYFDQLPSISGREKIGEEYIFILKLIQEIAAENWNPNYIDLLQVSRNSEISATSRTDFGVPYSSEVYQQVIEVLAHINPKAEVFLKSGCTDELIIQLHKEITADFIKSSLDEVKKIYTLCNLDDSLFGYICFQILEEEGDIGLSLTFRELNGITCIGSCGGDILDSYYNEFKSTALEDDFYVNHQFLMSNTFAIQIQDED